MTESNTIELAAVRAATPDALTEIRRLIEGEVTGNHTPREIATLAERAAKEGISEVGILHGAIRLLCDRLQAFVTEPDAPDRDTEIFPTTLGEIKTWACYSMPNGVRSLDGVFINGEWDFDLRFNYSARQIEAWQDECYRHVETLAYNANDPIPPRVLTKDGWKVVKS